MIAGLLRKDPAERLPTERAERELRLVAAGGTVRDDSGPARSSYAPTTMPPAGEAIGYPDPATTAAEPGPRPERDRRAGLVLGAGVLAVVVALAALTYALVNQSRGGDGSDGGASSAAATGGAHPSARDGGSGAPSSGTRDTGTPSSGAPAQSVHVTLTGAHTAYAGTCPPPAARAPVFTATFTVGRLPAEVRYR